MAFMDHQDAASSYIFAPQTEHYRLDWHRFNLKQRLLGRRPLPAEVFEEKTCTGEELGCLHWSPGAVSDLAGAFLCRDEVSASAGSLYSAPIGSSQGPELLLTCYDLL